MTPNTDKPDKPELGFTKFCSLCGGIDGSCPLYDTTPHYATTALPQANQGDDEIANMLQHIYMNESLYFSFTEDGVHPTKAAVALVQAHFDWLLAERLQTILDSLPMATEAEDIEGTTYPTGIARNRLRAAIGNVIKELMP